MAENPKATEQSPSGDGEHQSKSTQDSSVDVSASQRPLLAGRNEEMTSIPKESEEVIKKMLAVLETLNKIGGRWGNQVEALVDLLSTSVKNAIRLGAIHEQDRETQGRQLGALVDLVKIHEQDREIQGRQLGALVNLVKIHEQDRKTQWKLIDTVESLSVTPAVVQSIIHNTVVGEKKVTALVSDRDIRREEDFEAMRQVVVPRDEPRRPRPPQREPELQDRREREEESPSPRAFLEEGSTELAGMSTRPVPEGSDNIDLEAAKFLTALPNPWEGNPPARDRLAIFNIPKELSGDEKVWGRNVLDGFPKSASFIVLDKDRGSALFKRFDEASMRNILYLQSRVACLTAKQAEFDEEDFASERPDREKQLEELRFRIQQKILEPESPESQRLIRPDPRPTRDELLRSALDLAAQIDKEPKFLPKNADKEKWNRSGKEPEFLFGIRERETKWHPRSGSKQSLPEDPEESNRGTLFERLACLEGCIQAERTLLEHLVEVNGPIPRSSGKGQEPQEGSKVQTYPRLPRRGPSLARKRLGYLLWYIAQDLGVSPTYLLIYLINASVDNLADFSPIPIDELTMEALFALFPPPVLWLNIETTITNLEVMLQQYLIPYLENRVVPEAVYYAAKSWEEFEMFSSAEKMKQRRLQWETANPDTPWPMLNLSDQWIQKMQDRWYLAVDVKEALKEYHEALVLQKQLLEIPRPADRTKDVLSDWYSFSYSDKPQFLGNSQVNLYSDDVVTLKPPAEEDRVSNFISSKLQFWFLDKNISTRKVQYTKESKIGSWVTGINMVVAFASLVVAVWVLSVVNTYKTETEVKVDKRELATLTGFIVGFSLWVGFMTSLSRKEVFGAVAVYAAVLVVFIGSG